MWLKGLAILFCFNPIAMPSNVGVGDIKYKKTACEIKVGV